MGFGFMFFLLLQSDGEGAVDLIQTVLIEELAGGPAFQSCPREESIQVLVVNMAYVQEGSQESSQCCSCCMAFPSVLRKPRVLWALNLELA